MTRIHLDCSSTVSQERDTLPTPWSLEVVWDLVVWHSGYLEFGFSGFGLFGVWNCYCFPVSIKKLFYSVVWDLDCFGCGIVTVVLYLSKVSFNLHHGMAANTVRVNRECRHWLNVSQKKLRADPHVQSKSRVQERLIVPRACRNQATKLGSWSACGIPYP